MATLAIYPPMILSAAIIFFTVPLVWTFIAAERARATDWEDLLCKLRPPFL